MTDKKRKIKLQTRSRVVDGWMDGMGWAGLVFLTDLMGCGVVIPLSPSYYTQFLAKRNPFFSLYLKCPPVFALPFEEKKNDVSIS